MTAIFLTGTELALGDAELRAIAALLYRRAGISLHDGKRALVASRLHKRLRLGGFASFAEYLRFVERERSGDELAALLDAIAAGHTSFFREERHFAFLGAQAAGEWAGRETPIRGWSAACSTGEEAYSIAITLLETLRAPFSLLASDVSARAIAAAADGTYKLDRLQAIPRELVRKYFERGQGDAQGVARVHEDVRGLVRFANQNLLEIGTLGERFDFIFCRNVLVYFDLAARQQVVVMLERHLVEGGSLFISHSETLDGLAHGLQPVAPGVYRREDR